MLFLTLLLAHTLSFGKSLKTEQYIQCLERATSSPHSFNDLPVPNALSYSLCKLVLCLLASQEMRHRLTHGRALWGIHSKGVTEVDGGISSSFSPNQHTCTSDQAATGLERSPGSHFFVMCRLFERHNCLEGTRGGTTQ